MVLTWVPPIVWLPIEVEVFVELYPYKIARPSHRSSIFKSKNEVEVGAKAQARLLLSPEHTVRSSKRFIGDLEKFWKIHGKKITPVEIASHILREIKKEAEVALEERVEGVVITVPAYFNGLQKSQTKEAAEKAGLNVLELLKEPTAAAIAYGLDKEKDQTIIVYDLGGGTFDVSILEINNNKFIERGIDGNTFLGGDDFDEALKGYIIEQFESQYKSFTVDPLDDKRITEAAEHIKIQLSSVNRVEETIILAETAPLI